MSSSTQLCTVSHLYCNKQKLCSVGTTTIRPKTTRTETLSLILEPPQMLAKNNTKIRLDRKIPHYCQCEPEPDKMKINQKKCRMKKYIREKPKKIYQKSQIHILLLLLFFSSFSTFLKSIYFIYHFSNNFEQMTLF